MKMICGNRECNYFAKDGVTNCASVVLAPDICKKFLVLCPVYDEPIRDGEGYYPHMNNKHNIEQKK